ncbi:MAG: CHAP domain-containing protein [Roseococcus sp.]|nr:CHAP domain-containing protein [Roseococcus sp.]
MRLKAAALTVCVLIAGAGLTPPAQATRNDGRGELRGAPAGRATEARPGQAQTRSRPGQPAAISCVPYARAVTGMEISGNGRDWWHNAAGRYARGRRPEIGSVLAFPASGGMRAGHVAVVSRIHHNRLIEIDHANWGGPGIRRGQVMRGVQVIDVSEDNSWTRVRVQVGWSAENFGREYPTYGFIHNRPATTLAAEEDLVRPVAYTRREALRPGAPAARPAQPRATQPRPAAQRPAPVRTATAAR